ncbi:Fe2+/Zn2+ uptake regulation protein [Thermanaerovibrio velox DSM 12556]|uniref:Fe2+/Zn2+ uptake regulation protein n=1 Tax=Thermanaerovibrio velox DSM 12556 TaxID=926567 RepID=H0UNG7_9BACT|nr:transcriptional repressor [Thermanaerovibrio velox]EHM09374.1 Fe2+/Zn2+ uptake regulation protein [Thermanaerovibrio velox DSM 12556]
MDFESLFKLRGIRVTRFRLKLLAALREAGRPLSYQEMKGLMGREADKVTFYRNLEALCRAQVVHRVLGLDGAFRYCANDVSSHRCPGNHPHALCLRCGRMWCLKGEEMPRLEVPEGFRVEGKQLVVFGVCPDCEGEGRMDGVMSGRCL